MDNLLIIFVALAVAGLVMVVGLIVARMGESDKRKLQQRLGGESHSDDDLHTARSLRRHVQSSGLPEFLNRRPIVQGMQRWLTQGLPRASLLRFLLIEAAFIAAPAALIWVIAGNMVMVTITAIVGAILPYSYVASKRSKRQRQFSMQLPEALDFLSRVLRSGQSFSTGLQMMSEELTDPLASEFRRCYDQHSLGQSIEDGLRDMALRLNSPDFHFFTTAVVIQRQSGGDLAEVLHNISDMVRKRLRLAQGVRAKTAEGRFTGYIMVAFPAIMFAITYFIDPVRGDVMLKTSTGHMLIGVALGLEVLGLFLIKKITTIKV